MLGRAQAEATRRLDQRTAPQALASATAGSSRPAVELPPHRVGNVRLEHQPI